MATSTALAQPSNPNAGRLMSLDEDLFTALFDRHPFKIAHSLAAHPLLQLPLILFPFPPTHVVVEVAVELVLLLRLGLVLVVLLRSRRKSECAGCRRGGRGRGGGRLPQAGCSEIAKKIRQRD